MTIRPYVRPCRGRWTVRHPPTETTHERRPSQRPARSPGPGPQARLGPGLGFGLGLGLGFAPALPRVRTTTTVGILRDLAGATVQEIAQALGLESERDLTVPKSHMQRALIGLARDTPIEVTLVTAPTPTTHAARNKARLASMSDRFSLRHNREQGERWKTLAAEFETISVTAPDRTFTLRGTP